MRAEYEPVDTDQPLRWALSFMISKYRAGQRGGLGLRWQQIRRTDAALGAALDRFSAGCKKGAGFTVLQDHPFLHGGH
jgi:hypothetical protein